MGRVRLRSDLLKFKDRKMSHFVLLREIDIFLSLNFVNHLARPKAAQLHIFPRTTFYFLQLCRYIQKTASSHFSRTDFLFLNGYESMCKKVVCSYIVSRTIFHFLRPYKYAPMAATQGTVEIMPTEPAIDLINSMATKSVFTSWINVTP